MMLKKFFVTALAVVAMVAVMTAGVASAVSVDYAAAETAMGGWDYSYTGDADAWTATGAVTALDGTWAENNSWDGTAPGSGGSSGTGPAPGGMASYTEGGVTYLRIQDTGQPSEYAVPFSGQVNWNPANANRRYDITHALAGTDIIDSGITISFRARIATTGTLSDEYREGGAGTFAWPTDGAGSVTNEDARAQFGVSQGGGGGTIGFAMMLTTDPLNPGALGASGVNMNNNPASTTGVGYEDAGDLSETNVVSVSDAGLTGWNEFFITMQEDLVGNWRVRVFKNGSTTPEAFTALKTFTGDHDGVPNLVMGHNSGSATYAIDVDFFSYKSGVQAIPEPSTIALGLMGLVGLGFVGIRRRR